MPALHTARDHKTHFHTSSNNSFNGYARSFYFLGKLVDGLIRVLVGVGINVGSYTRQFNCKHKLVLRAHDTADEDNSHFYLLHCLLCQKTRQQGNLFLLQKWTDNAFWMLSEDAPCFETLCKWALPENDI